MILGNDDASMMTVRKQKAAREEIQLPWKENRAGQSWRAGSWGPGSNVLLVGMRVVTTEQLLLQLHDFYSEPCALEKPMYPLRVSEINESLGIISA